MNIACWIRTIFACAVCISTTFEVHAEGPINKNVAVVKLADGYKFTEGPVWDGKGLFFSDIPNKKILRFTPGEGASTFKMLEGASNGLRLDGKGNLVACQPVGRAVLQITAEGETKVLADKYDGKKLNSPNDLWIDRNGGVYLTDPRYGNMDGMEQDGFHVYYLSPASKLTRVIDDLKKPNGVIGSADGKRLYVADAGAGKSYVYTIKPDGSLEDRKLAAPVGSDGLALDTDGNLYVTTKSGIAVYSPEAKLIGEIAVPESPANMTFGGADGRTMFITARTGLYSVELNAKDGSDPFAK